MQKYTQMTCLSIGFHFYVWLKGYLLATLHELLKFIKTWNHFKLHKYNSVITQFSREMKMNRTGRTPTYVHFYCCVTDSSPKNNRHLLFHSFHRSGFWTQSSWVLCSGCQKAAVKVSTGGGGVVAVLRWWRNRTGRPLSPLQIHRKNIWTLSKFHKTTSEHWQRTSGTQKTSPLSSKGGRTKYKR